MAKRVKYVYDSSQEVFHLWANQTQDSARQGGSITQAYFEGKSCYSYGSHYEVGRLVKIKGKTVVLINQSGYSHTTSKHINEASSASQHLPKIIVDHTFDWQSGIKKMRENLVNGFNKILKRRSFWNEYKVWDNYAQNKVKEFNKLCKFVGKSKLQFKPTKAYLKKLQAHVDYRIARQAALKAVKHTPEYLAVQAERKAKAQALEQIKQEIEITNWKSGGPYTSAVNSLNPRILRINNGEVETSSHAHVNLEDAKQALKKFLKGELKVGDKVSDFKFDGVNKYSSSDDPIIYIGCHCIFLSEIKRVLMPNSIKLVS